eukprot:scaffold443806_cov18-Prasinocladus_malaysianus.AAC.1
MLRYPYRYESLHRTSTLALRTGERSRPAKPATSTSTGYSSADNRASTSTSIGVVRTVVRVESTQQHVPSSCGTRNRSSMNRGCPFVGRSWRHGYCDACRSGTKRKRSLPQFTKPKVKLFTKVHQRAFFLERPGPRTRVARHGQVQ